MQRNIWTPLGIQTMTFFPHQNPDLSTRIPVLSSRGADGKLHPFNEPFITTNVTGCFGGQGLYSSMGDYLLFLRSLLSPDSALLSPTSINELFIPQLTPPKRPPSAKSSSAPSEPSSSANSKWRRTATAGRSAGSYSSIAIKTEGGEQGV